MTVSRKLALSVLAVLVLLVAGCAPRASAPVPDLVWATGRIGVPVANDVAAAWNAVHPQGPRVRVEPLPQAANEQRRLLALELGAGLPDIDVLDLDVIWTAEFASKGWLRDLDGLCRPITAAALPVPLRSATWNGRLWAAPFTTNVGLLYYRTDLVATPPRTWDDLVATGHRVGSAHGIAPFVVDGAPGEGLVVQFLEHLWAQGGDLDAEDASGAPDRFHDPAVAALTFIGDGYRTGLYAPGTETMQLEDARRTFQSGQAVFLRSWPYAYRLMTGQDPTSQVVGHVGIAPLPAGPAGSTPALGGDNLAVSRFSRDPDDAERFIRFATTDPGVQLRLAAQYSLAPGLAAAYDDLPDDPLMALLGTVLPTARTRPVTADWASISEEAQQQIVAATVDGADPEASVAALRDFLDATDGPGQSGSGGNSASSCRMMPQASR